MDTAWSLATDPAVFGPAWAYAAAGWLALQVVPLGVRAALEAAAMARAARLRATRTRVAEAWGLDADGESDAG